MKWSVCEVECNRSFRAPRGVITVPCSTGGMHFIQFPTDFARKKEMNQIRPQLVGSNARARAKQASKETENVEYETE